MILADLSPAKRRTTVQTALEITLRDLLAAEGTAEVVERIRRSLGIAASETKLLARTVVGLAPAFPECQRSEATFQRYGRTMRRMIWSPRI